MAEGTKTLDARIDLSSNFSSCESQLPPLPAQEHYAHERTQWEEITRAMLANLGLMVVAEGGVPLQQVRQQRVLMAGLLAEDIVVLLRDAEDGWSGVAATWRRHGRVQAQGESVNRAAPCTPSTSARRRGSLPRRKWSAPASLPAAAA